MTPSYIIPDSRLPKASLPHLIGLIGPIGAGKDLLSALLSMLGYQYLSFAQSLRQELYTHAKSNALPPDELLQLPPTHLARLGWLRMINNPKALWTKPTEPPIRALLQWYGTDYRRGQDPSYWLNAYTSSYNIIQSLGPALVPSHTGLVPISTPDVRFDNECQLILELGGILLYIQTKPTDLTKSSTSEHSSEQSHRLLRYATHTISNIDVTQTQLATNLLTLLLGSNALSHIWPNFHYTIERA